MGITMKFYNAIIHKQNAKRKNLFKQVFPFL